MFDIDAIDGGRSFGWLKHGGKHGEGRGLAGSVRSQEAEDLALPDLKTDMVHSDKIAKSPG